MQYVALIYTNEAEDRKLTDTERQERMQRYFAFSGIAREQNALLGGDALHGTDTATCVRVRNGETMVTDGPFAETREALGGFYLLDCRDLDHAIELAKQIPAADHGTIEIRPVMVIPGDG